MEKYSLRIPSCTGSGWRMHTPFVRQLHLPRRLGKEKALVFTSLSPDCFLSLSGILRG